MTPYYSGLWRRACCRGFAMTAHLESYPDENDPPETCHCPLGRDHTLREWIKWETERPKSAEESA